MKVAMLSIRHSLRQCSQGSYRISSSVADEDAFRAWLKGRCFRDAEHTAPGQLPIRNTQDQWPKVGDDTELAFLRSTEAQARTIPHSKGSRPTGILTTWNQGPVTR